MQNTLKTCYRFVLPLVAVLAIILPVALILGGYYPKDISAAQLLPIYSLPIAFGALLMVYTRLWDTDIRKLLYGYRAYRYSAGRANSVILALIAAIFAAIPVLALPKIYIFLYICGMLTLFILASKAGSHHIKILFGPDYAAGELAHRRRQLKSMLVDDDLQPIRRDIEAVIDTLNTPQVLELINKIGEYQHAVDQQAELEDTLTRASELRAEAQHDVDMQLQDINNALKRIKLLN